METGLPHGTLISPEQHQHSGFIGLQSEKAKETNYTASHRQQSEGEEQPDRVPNAFHTCGNGVDKKNRSAQKQQKHKRKYGRPSLNGDDGLAIGNSI